MIFWNLNSPVTLHLSHTSLDYILDTAGRKLSQGATSLVLIIIVLPIFGVPLGTLLLPLQLFFLMGTKTCLLGLVCWSV